MKKTSTLWTVLFLVSLFAAGCQQQPEADDMDMAAGLCQCMRPMAESLKAINALSAAGEGDALEEARKSLGATAQAVDECLGELEEEYGEALEKREEEIRALMAEKCPEVSQVMQEAEAGF
jgi:hypothetical protein